MYYLLGNACEACSPCVNTCLPKKEKSKKGLVYSDVPLWSGHIKDVFKSSALILYTNVLVSRIVWKRSKKEGWVGGRRDKKENPTALSWTAVGRVMACLYEQPLLGIKKRLRGRGSGDQVDAQWWALNVKVVSVGGRGLFCPGNYLKIYSLWSKCQIRSSKAFVHDSCRFYILDLLS